MVFGMASGSFDATICCCGGFIGGWDDMNIGGTVLPFYRSCWRSWNTIPDSRCWETFSPENNAFHSSFFITFSNSIVSWPSLMSYFSIDGWQGIPLVWKKWGRYASFAKTSMCHSSSQRIQNLTACGSAWPLKRFQWKWRVKNILNVFYNVSNVFFIRSIDWIVMQLLFCTLQVCGLCHGERSSKFRTFFSNRPRFKSRF